MRESDSFWEAKARKKRGARGKKEEDTVDAALKHLELTDLNFGFDRHYDSRSAGRPMPATVADFTFCYGGKAGALEVKSTKHSFRLQKSKFPQFPRLQRRLQAGAVCLLIIHHSDDKLWRLVNIASLEVIERGSWDLSRFPTFEARGKKASDNIVEELLRVIRDPD